MDLRQHLEESLTKALGRPIVVRGDIPTDVFNALNEGDQRALAARLIESIRGKEAADGNVDALFGVAIGIKRDGTAEIISETEIGDDPCPHEESLYQLTVAMLCMANTLLRVHEVMRAKVKDDSDKLIMVRDALMGVSPDTLRKLLDKLGKD